VKIMRVELSDGRVINIREPFPSEFREARLALAEVAKMEDFSKDVGLEVGKAISGDMVAKMLTDPRMDGLTSPEVIKLVGLLSDLKEEADKIGMSDYFALLVATAEVTAAPFAQTQKRSPSSSTKPAGRSPTGRSTSSSKSSAGKSSALSGQS
jgi:hypothetical protein